MKHFVFLWYNISIFRSVNRIYQRPSKSPPIGITGSNPVRKAEDNMKIELQEPFKSKWKSGYLRESEIDGRKRVDLFNSNKDRTTIAYAKYLMSVHLGHEIPEGYEVDHIDDDSTNDEISNLQLLTEEEHLLKTTKSLSTGRTMIKLVCPVCGNEFEREKRQVKVSNPKCSRRCNGLASKNLQ